MIQLRKLFLQLTIFFILANLPLSLLHAQGDLNSTYIPSLIPPSPNASALMKFTDVPVSTYTGTADVTVPIYTIQAKGITVPISLSYHTGGIKLKEEASWVGLGWVLNSGGMISRTIMGNDDFGTQGNIYFTSSCPQLPGDLTFPQPAQATNAPFLSLYVFDFYCSYQVNTSAGTEDFYPAFAASGDTYDMEPDIFSYNFAGHSGKFILTRAGTVVMEKQENIRIQYQGSGNQVTFTITDDQGNTFYFNVLELTAVAPKPSQISSWLLSKIVTQQRDSIMFNYTSGGTTTSTMPDTYQTYSTYCDVGSGLVTSSLNPPAYFNQTLQSIDFSNGHLQFAFDTSRSDLWGANKLDSIMIYSKNIAGAQTYLKQDNFYYSYFNSGQSNHSEYYRLKLDSVKEKSGALSLPPYSFTYNNPNPGFQSAKHSYNIDHWGYYNGADNSTLIPSMDIEYSPVMNNPFYLLPLFFNYAGGNRQPDFSSMQSFSLQQVTYPTGGKTVFAYEPNDYDYSNSLNGYSDPLQYVQLLSMDSLISTTRHGMISGTIDLTHIFPVLTSTDPGTNVTVNVGFRYQANNNFAYSNTVGKIYFTLGGSSWDINGATCQPGGSVCTSSLSLKLDPSVYNWSAYIDASIDTATVFAGIYVSIQYQVTQQTYNLLQNNNAISPAAGLRIHSITNYKDANAIASQKIYSYTYWQDKLLTGQPQQYSFGRLMSIPSYARYWPAKTLGGGNCPMLYLSGSTTPSFTSIIQGNIVGYDQVAEYSVDPATGQDIGKTIYLYSNTSDTTIPYNGFKLPGTQNMGNNLNGLLLSKIDYANNSGVYTKVGETDNYYHTTNRTVYYSPKYQYEQGGTLSLYCSGGNSVETQTLACFYPSIKSERVLLDSSRNIFFQQGDTTHSVMSTIADYYDNSAHYQVTRSRTINSKGDTVFTVIKYPQDYIPSGHNVTGNTILDSLIGRNMVGETVEKRDSLTHGSSFHYITGARLNLYKILSGNNTIVPDKIYKLDIQSPITNFSPFSINNNTTNMDSRNRQMASFDQYDANNNLQQYTTVDQEPTTILWDYVHVYPIAQVKNAVLADVAVTSFEADGKGNWTYAGASTPDTTSITGNNCYNLAGGNITKSGLSSSGTYILSYWTKNASALTITGTMSGYPIRGKTIGPWTYYEHKITGQSTVTVSGTGYIDELRLFPANAQMISYTYSPLIGITSQCDVDNKVTYYFYDGLGRLEWIKDQDKNIIKTFQYHYQNSTTQY